MTRRVSELERGSMVATVLFGQRKSEKVFINQTSTGMLCRKQNQVRSWGERGDQCHSWGGDCVRIGVAVRVGTGAAANMVAIGMV